MDSLENSIKDCISKQLESGIIEKIITEKLETCIDKSLDDLFSWSGEITKIIEDKIKSVMIPYLEKYDYSDYIVKLDEVLVEILKNTSLDNKKILENFKELMSVDISIKSVKVSEIFEKWCEYVAKNVDTSNLELDYDDEPMYEPVDVSYTFKEIEGESWLKKKEGRLFFECEQDEDMNFCLELYKFNDLHEKNRWEFRFDDTCDISSLRHLDDFKLYLMSLKHAGVEIEIDESYISENVRPDKEPEIYYS